MAELTKEEILKMIGFEEKEGADFKQFFEEKFIGVDLHKKEFGAFEGKFKTMTEAKLKNNLSKLGVPAEDIKGKALDELYDVFEKAAEGFGMKVTDLEKKLSEKGTSNEWEKAYGDLEKKYKDLEELSKGKDGRIVELESSYEKAIKDYEGKIYRKNLTDRVQGSFEKAAWANVPNLELVKKGIWAELNNKFIFDFEGDNVVVFNNDEGKTMVKDGNTSQMTIEKLVENTLKEHKVYQENRGNPNPTKQVSDTNANGVKKSAQQIEHEKKIMDKIEASKIR